MADPFSPQAIWGRALASYRRSAGLTQQQLADTINFAPALISGVETALRGITLGDPEDIHVLNESMELIR
jgi:transcriptional regulator with XRE-family HTH domain